MIEKIFKSAKTYTVVSYLLVLALLYLTSTFNYLLFHLLAETFSIVVGFSIFILAWNSRRRMHNNYLLLLGISYLFVCFLDLFHTFAYKGMGVIPDAGANLPTQFWISARYLQVTALLVAPIFFNRRLNAYAALYGFAIVTSLLTVAIFNDTFPASYIEGDGLTVFKVVSEYVISAAFLLSIYLLNRIKDAFDDHVFRWLVTSYVVMAVSELVFTLYVDVYDFANLAGHFLKLVSVYFMYIALVETGLEKPHRLLYRDLVQNEEKLKLALGEVQRLAITDPLTGMFNRRYFSDLAENEVQRALRYRHDLSLIFLDIDDFKWVNDTYGHAAGDQILQNVAECCQNELRSIDVTSRFGGDEFIILLPECDLDTARQVAERLRLRIASKAMISSRGFINVTASMGVAGLEHESPWLEDLLKKADASLYEAKTGGRNKVNLAQE